MSEFNKLPNHTILGYRLNDVTGWYVQTDCSRPVFSHLPDELKTESSNQPFLIKQGATECIKGRQKRYSKFFTGLRKTAYPGLFIGDNIADKPSIIFFDFSHDRAVLTVVYIGGYKVFPKVLKTFTTTVKRRILDAAVNK
jgi:hypothetical protein